MSQPVSFTNCSIRRFISQQILHCRKMGVGVQNGERLRTIWTTEMDRFFIDLLLEQVGVGNKFDDNLFSKRAWKHMSSLFNAKFNFQYEKDVLKNRHKTLRNLYRGVKHLLAQPGFSWDEKRNMAIADNNVWDEYLKVHPGGRPYRVKTIPHFRDLCTIYGHVAVEEKGDNAPEGSSNSGENGIIKPNLAKDISEDDDEVLHDIKVDDDSLIFTLENATNDSEQRTTKETAATFSNRSRTYWQPPMDRYFINLLLAHVHKGNRVDGVFSKQAWMEMISSFNENFGSDYSLEILKNRYKTLRRQYMVLKNLLDLDGFVWDEARQMVTADDCVWQDYIKVHTDARQFMTRPVPYYKDLRIIYDQTYDEKMSSLPQDSKHQNVIDVKTENPAAIDAGHSPTTTNSYEDQFSYVWESTDTGQKQKRQLETCFGSSSPKKSRGDVQGMAMALHEMATAVSSLSTKNDDNLISIENVIKAVQELPDMDEDLVLDACDFLEDERKAKTFLALDAKLRKKWLIRKLRTQV